MTLDPLLGARLFFIAASLFLGILAVICYQRRNESHQALTFCFLLVASALYVFGYSGQIAQTTVPQAYRWVLFQGLATPWLYPLWLLIAFQHNRRKVPVPALFVIPAIVFVLRLTDPWHGLFFGSKVMVVHGPFHILSMSYGPFCILQNIYALAAYLLSIWLYANSVSKSAGFYRRQSLLMLIFTIIVLVSYIFPVFGLIPHDINISPFSMVLIGGVYFYALFGFGSFNTVPLTRRLIFSSMRDAVLVVDTNLRLLDFNPAAQNLLPTLEQKHIGQPALQVFAPYDGLTESLTSPETTEINLTMATGLGWSQLQDRSFEVRSFPLIARNRIIGYAAILADMTAQTLLREQLRLHAETDPLTGIANRRLFDQALERECKRSDRFNMPFSLLMIDVDHFKRINDKFGHPAGDEVLRTLARRIRERVRESDLLARYGGEEFAILLVETPLGQAYILAEHIRAAVQDEPFVLSTMQLPVTVSIGLATRAPGDLTSPVALMKQADLALYQAKAHGRNQTAVAQNPHQTQPA